MTTRAMIPLPSYVLSDAKLKELAIECESTMDEADDGAPELALVLLAIKKELNKRSHLVQL